MSLPREVITGPFTWRVLWEAPDDGAYGTTDTYTLTIQVRPDLADDLARETLMHETLHAAYRAAGLNSEIAKEEEIVSGMSPFVLDALRRSPGLAEYLIGPVVGRPATGKRGGA